jgi:hypothetical protein
MKLKTECFCLVHVVDGGEDKCLGVAAVNLRHDLWKYLPITRNLATLPSKEKSPRVVGAACCLLGGNQGVSIWEAELQTHNYKQEKVGGGSLGTVTRSRYTYASLYFASHCCLCTTLVDEIWLSNLLVVAL